MPRFARYDWLKILALAALYFVAARLGLKMAFLQLNVSPVWPPTGIALAALLLFGYRAWPGVFLGALVATYLAPTPLPIACGIALGNTLEALLGAYLVHRLIGHTRVLDSPGYVLRFVVLGGLASTLVSATFGVASLYLGGAIPSGLVGPLWLTWWIGDAAGAVIYAPLLLAWSEAQREGWTPARLAEALALLLVVVLTSLASFGPFSFSRLPIAYLTLPLLVWAVFRFKRLGATTAIFVVTAIADWGTARGYGSFSVASPNQALLLLQIYIAVVALSTLMLGAVILQREQGLEELARSHSVLKAQQEGSLDGILVVDENQRVVSFNRHFQDMWCIPVEVMRTMRDERLLSFAQDQVVEWQRFIEKVHYLYAHPELSSEDEIELSDGRVLERYSTPAVSPEGVNYGRIWYFRDITQRKRMELTLLRQYEDLKKLDVLKNSFVSTVSHELRTPLTSLIGFAEFLEDRIAGPLTQQQGDFVRQIQESAQRLRVLVDDLLDFSRLQTGELSLECQQADLARLVTDAVGALQPQAHGAGLQLEARVPASPLCTRLDPARIGQVLFNLLGNATKFTPQGGRVAVSVLATPDELRVEVSDTGIGIAPEHLPHLFERFYQVERGNTRVRGGAGLGLAISRAIIEAHGGHIGVESEPDRGSRFWFTLPRESLEEAGLDC